MITKRTRRNWLPGIEKEMIGCLLSLLIACSCTSGLNYKSPPNYNFNKPEEIKLPEELDEISGLAYYGPDKSLFAECDDKGYIYKIPLDKPKAIKRWKVVQKSDYEDIVMVDSVFYLLNSNGNIVVVQFFKGDSVAATKYHFPEKGYNEFETLYYDPELRKLVMVCKECEEEKKTNNTVYSFDMQRYSYDKLFVIDSRSAVAESATKASKFKPSGAAIHPLNGDVYLLSSVNKELVIADRSGQIKEIYQLDPKKFRHPEGITFSPTGGLYISNESEESYPANILYFEYHKGVKE